MTQTKNIREIVAEAIYDSLEDQKVWVWRRPPGGITEVVIDGECDLLLVTDAAIAAYEAAKSEDVTND